VLIWFKVKNKVGKIFVSILLLAVTVIMFFTSFKMDEFINTIKTITNSNKIVDIYYIVGHKDGTKNIQN